MPPYPAFRREPRESALLARKMRQIVPIAMSVETVDSTYKLNQNRSDTVRAGAAAALSADGTPGMETRELAALMQQAGTETAAD